MPSRSTPPSRSPTSSATTAPSRTGRCRFDGTDTPAGPTVTAMAPDGAAARAGIVPGDVLVSINGREVLDLAHVTAMVHGFNPGATVEIELLRAGAPDEGRRDARQHPPRTGRRRLTRRGSAVESAEHGSTMTSRTDSSTADAEPDASELDDVDRELLNAVQWDFPLDAASVRGPRRAARHPRARGAGADRKASRTQVCSASSRRSSTRARSDISSALDRREGRPRAHRRGRGDRSAEHPGVSHNYKRNHAYNLWYTIAVPPGESLDEHIDVLHRDSGSLVTRKLPTLKLYKIGVKLDMTGKTAANAKTEVLEHEMPGAQGGDAGARPLRSRARHDPHRAGGPAERRASVRGAGANDSASTKPTSSTRSARSRSASSCAGSPPS